EADVSVAFVGRTVNLERLLVPTHAPERAEKPLSVDRLERALAERKRDELETLIARCAVHCWSFRLPRFEQVVTRAAHALSQRLSLRYPDLRFAVVRHTDWERERKVLFFERYRAGWLEIRGMTPTAAGRLVSVKLADGALRDPATVRGDVVASTLLSTRSFDEKLDRLDALLIDLDAPTGRSRPEVVRLYVDALLVDL